MEINMKFKGLFELIPYIHNHKTEAVLIIILALVKAVFSLIPIQLLGKIIDILAVEVNEMDVKALLIESSCSLYLFAFSMVVFLNHGIDNVYGYLTFLFTDKIVNDVRNDAVGWALNSFRPLKEQKKEGDVISRLSGDIESVAQMLSSPVNNLLPLAYKFLVSLFVLFWWNPVMGTIATLLITPLYAFSYWIGVKSKNIVSKQRIAQGELVNEISNVLDSMPVINAWRAEEYESNKLRLLSNKIFDLKKQLHIKYMIYWFLTQLLTGIGVVSAVWISYKSVLLGAMSAGSITVAYNYMQNVLTPIGSLSRYVRNLHEIDIALLRIFGLRSEQCTREDSEKLKSTPDIVFSDVCVCCNDDHFLKNVTFSVKPGSLAVLSGPSGIGKSTLLHAVIGYQPLQNGSIKMGGMESLHCIEAIGVSFQLAYLFDRSIRENIAFGKDLPNDMRILSIAEKVGLSELIVERGLDFLVGTHGNALSGGERRKVALARAFYNPKLCYLLDEPTAELDDLSRKKVINYLKQLKQNATVLITSHDEDILAIADQIVSVAEFVQNS